MGSLQVDGWIKLIDDIMSLAVHILVLTNRKIISISSTSGVAPQSTDQS